MPTIFYSSYSHLTFNLYSQQIPRTTTMMVLMQRRKRGILIRAMRMFWWKVLVAFGMEMKMTTVQTASILVSFVFVISSDKGWVLIGLDY